MANKEKIVPPTLEMIQDNPYNYTFDEVAKCMGEERAKSLFKNLYKSGVSPKNQKESKQAKNSQGAHLTASYGLDGKQDIP